MSLRKFVLVTIDPYFIGPTMSGHDLQKWIAEISATIDNKDDVKFASYFQPDGVFRYGNQPEVTGTDGVASYVKAFFGSIESLQHELVALHESKHSDTITWQGRCTYVRLDKHVVTIDFCNILTMEGPLIKTYMVYIDTTPLFAPID